MKKIAALLTLAGGMVLWMGYAVAAGRGVLWSRLADGGATNRDRAMTIAVSGDNVVAAGFLRVPDPGGLVEFLENAHVRSYSRGGTLNWTLSRSVDRSQYWDSVADGSGNVILLGINDPVSGADDNLFVTKATAAGTVAWEVVLPISGYAGVSTGSFLPRVVLRDGVIYLMASISGHPTDNNAILVSALSAGDGTVLWTRLLTGPGGFGLDGGTGLAAGDDGAGGGTALAIAGWARDAAGGRGGIYVARIDPAAGGPVWERTVQNAGAQSESRDIIIAGATIAVAATLEEPAVAGQFAAGIVALDLAGNESWRDNTAGSNPSNTNSATTLGAAGGSLYAAGVRDNGHLDSFIRAYDPVIGALKWNRDIQGIAFTGGPAFLLAFPGTVVAVGGQFPSGAATYAPGIVFLDNTAGTVVDNVVFTQSVNDQDRIVDGAAGGDGTVFAAGRMANPNPAGTQDFFVGAAGVLPPAPSGGGGGGSCSTSPVPRQSDPPAWEWGLPFAPALFLALRRMFRRAFSCNKGVNP